MEHDGFLWFSIVSYSPAKVRLCFFLMRSSICIIVLAMVTYGFHGFFPMVFLEVSYGFATVLLWFVHGFLRCSCGFLWLLVVFVWFYSGIRLFSCSSCFFSYGFLRLSYDFPMGFPMVFLWSPYDYPMVSYGLLSLSHCSPMVSYCFSASGYPGVSLKGPQQSARGFHMVFIWFSYSVPNGFGAYLQNHSWKINSWNESKKKS